VGPQSKPLVIAGGRVVQAVEALPKGKGKGSGFI